MARNIITGIDIGTYQVKIIVAEYGKGKDAYFPRIIGTGFSESKGLRHGYIINSSDVVRSIRSAIEQAEKSSQSKIKRAYLSIGGVGLEEVKSKGEVIITRADGEITDLDIRKALDDSEEKVSARISNRKIIHVIPLRFKIDGEVVLGRPVGMKGMRLEIETLFVTCLEQHLNDLIQAVEEVGVEVDDVMASPIAASLVTLTKTQKMAGCVLANIGSETVSSVVFEDNIPISLKVFPIGSTDITNDIALGLKVSLEEAEQIKKGAITSTEYPKKKLDEIIVARLSDIFELIENHLKKIGKNGLLPAGIIMTGGGSGITTIEDLAKAALKLPSKLATPRFGENARIKDASWAVAYGLCIWGSTADEDESPIGIGLAQKTGGNFLQWIKQFLP
ncbi:cell division protein FtsA [Candidatus Kaiserbacteria bacterium]|nr:cell division protein FtsA [Candidatus Kaiserbacteria bacterium]